MTIYFLKDYHGHFYTSNSVNGYFNGKNFEETRFYTRLSAAKAIRTKAKNNYSNQVYIFSLEIDENHAIHCG